MAKNLKFFETNAEYQAYMGGSDKILPNISFCDDEKIMHYNRVLYLSTVFNVTDASQPTKIVGNTPYLEGEVISVVVDDEEIDISDIISSGEYQLSSGEHTIVYALLNVNTVNHILFGCTSIKSVAVPYGIVSIGRTAFSGCTGLETVTLPNTVTSIDEMAFNDCRNLVGVVIPDSVTSIGNGAFDGCASFINITIPSGVVSIVGNAFKRCPNLTSITVSSGNTKYNSRNDCNAIIETATNTLITACNSTVIPNDVTSIGAHAFDGCNELVSITIADGVTSIGQSAFSGCSSLSSITVSSGNTVYDSRDNCNAIIETVTNTLIAGCENTTIPNGVTTIGDFAFNGHTGLTSKTIPDTVTTIGSFAFGSCDGLTDVTIGNGVTSIGGFAFGWCTGLSSVTIQATTPPSMFLPAFENNAEGRKFYVPAASVNDYKSASDWYDYANDIEAIA